VDFIKVYVWMRAEVMRAIADEAHRLGVQVTAHVGFVTTVEDAVRVGVDSLEHVRMGPELLSPDNRQRYDALPRRALDPLANYRSWRYVDVESEAADGLIELLIERGIYWTPTLTWSLSILQKDDPDVSHPAGIDMVPERVQEQWKSYLYYFDYSDEDFQLADDEMANQMRFVGRAQAAGVRVTAGTDTSNPSVVPGHSLHKELQLLVRSGFTPMEALVAATGRAAELLGRQNEFGTIQKRRYADFLVLDADPLKSIENTRKIAAVFREGKEEVGSLTAM
jgi:imidazolonepropionase-like amidohydrolase